MKKSFFNMELLILAPLCEKDCYGYEISSLISKNSNNVLEIKEGALYPILSRLKEGGYISSYDEIVNKKIRVYYHLEEAGFELFEQLKKEFYEKYGAVDTILKGINLYE